MILDTLNSAKENQKLLSTSVACFSGCKITKKSFQRKILSFDNLCTPRMWNAMDFLGYSNSCISIILAGFLPTKSQSTNSSYTRFFDDIFGFFLDSNT